MKHTGLAVVVAVVLAHLAAHAHPLQNPVPKSTMATARGAADIELTKPNATTDGDEMVTTFRVKNVGMSPLVGFKVEESWFRGDELVTSTVYNHQKPLQPGEIIEITLRTKRQAITDAKNQFRFSHAGGNVKPQMVPKLDLPQSL